MVSGGPCWGIRGWVRVTTGATRSKGQKLGCGGGADSQEMRHPPSAASAAITTILMCMLLTAVLSPVAAFGEDPITLFEDDFEDHSLGELDLVSTDWCHLMSGTEWPQVQAVGGGHGQVLHIFAPGSSEIQHPGVTYALPALDDGDQLEVSFDFMLNTETSYFFFDSGTKLSSGGIGCTASPGAPVWAIPGASYRAGIAGDPFFPLVGFRTGVPNAPNPDSQVNYTREWPLSAGTWHSCLLVNSPTGFSLFVDGALVYAHDNPYYAFEEPEDWLFRIGDADSHSYFRCDMLLDNVRIAVRPGAENDAPLTLPFLDGFDAPDWSSTWCYVDKYENAGSAWPQRVDVGGDHGGVLHVSNPGSSARQNVGVILEVPALGDDDVLILSYDVWFNNPNSNVRVELVDRYYHAATATGCLVTDPHCQVWTPMTTHYRAGNSGDPYEPFRGFAAGVSPDDNPDAVREFAFAPFDVEAGRWYSIRCEQVPGELVLYVDDVEVCRKANPYYDMGETRQWMINLGDGDSHSFSPIDAYFDNVELKIEAASDTPALSGVTAPGAAVSVLQGGQPVHVVSGDFAGEFAFYGLPEGDYEICASKAGYISSELEDANVPEDAEKPFDLRLSPVMGNEVSMGGWVANWDLDGYCGELPTHWSTLDHLSLFSAKFENDGSLDHLIAESCVRSIASLAHGQQTAVYLTLEDRRDEAHPEELHDLLCTPNIRESHIEEIIGFVVRERLEGVDVDYEWLDEYEPEETLACFRSFLVELGAQLHLHGKLLAVSVNPSHVENFSGVDEVRMMAYDNCWKEALAETPHDENAPLACDSLPYHSRPGWIEEELDWILGDDPGLREKLVLGLPLYGHKTRIDGGHAVYWKQVEAMLSERDKYAYFAWGRDSECIPHFTYTEAEDGPRINVWYEDDASTYRKLDLVLQYGLKGATFWYLGPNNTPECTFHRMQDILDGRRFSECSSLCFSLVGDINGDGDVTSLDARLAYAMAQGGYRGTPAQRDAADVDRDGDVDMDDAVILAEYAIDIRTELP